MSDPKEWGFHVIQELKRINKWCGDINDKVDQIAIDVAVLKSKSAPKLPPILYGGGSAAVVVILIRLFLYAIGQKELADAIPASN